MAEKDGLDVLAIAAHPDDVELSAGGTLLKLADQGYRTGILDLTRGEAGTRGTPEQRASEAASAGRILGVQVRENLDLGDSHIWLTEDSRVSLVRALRRLSRACADSLDDPHPTCSHGSLVREAAIRRTRQVRSQGRNERFRPNASRIFFFLEVWCRPSSSISLRPGNGMGRDSLLRIAVLQPQSRELESRVSSQQFQREHEARDRHGALIGTSGVKPSLCEALNVDVR
jgi:LmbE family N-acetylglucosaminyl deacetylase